VRTISSLPKIAPLPAVFRLGALALLFTASMAASSALFAQSPQASAAAKQTAQPASKPSTLQVAQAWIRDLFGTGIAPGLPDRPPPRGEIFPDSDDRPVPRERPAHFSGTYRTVCVRLCDGFYFPISFSTSRSRFASDAARCESSCPKRSRLFVHPTGVSDEPAHMTDLQGRPYSELPNANRSQKEYVVDCTCRGNPWDPQEAARHQAYAADAAKKPVADAGKSKAANVSSRPPRGNAIAGRGMRDEN
jgi:hypothetical protein